jgi:hypothetical protein
MKDVAEGDVRESMDLFMCTRSSFVSRCEMTFAATDDAMHGVVHAEAGDLLAGE